MNYHEESFTTWRKDAQKRDTLANIYMKRSDQNPSIWWKLKRFTDAQSCSNDLANTNQKITNAAGLQTQKLTLFKISSPYLRLIQNFRRLQTIQDCRCVRSTSNTRVKIVLLSTTPSPISLNSTNTDPSFRHQMCQLDFAVRVTAHS